MTDYTYFAREHGTYGPVKIGRSCKPITRASSLSAETGKRIELICVVPFDCEHEFHQKFADWHQGKEWFAWSYLMQVTISRLIVGTFDFASLPAPKKVVGAGKHLKPYIGRFAHADATPADAQVAA